MIRLNITESMINFIKNNRDKYNIKSSEVAEKIGKSNAYISKFDKGDYKTISYGELCQMLSVICGNEDEGKRLVDDFLTNYILNEEQSTKIINDDYGLITYDDVLRLIEIPSNLVDYINQEISENKLEISNIITTANNNSDLPEYTKNSKYEYNVYYPLEIDDSQNDQNEIGSFIKVYLDKDLVSNILIKNITSSNYLTLEALLYTINRLKKHGVNFSSTIANNILSKFRFYNLRETRFAKNANESRKEADDEMNNLPSLFVNTLSNFTRIVSSFLKQHPDYTISKIMGFHNNLSKDPSFVMAILDLPLSKVKDLDVDDKRKLVDEIYNLIKKYGEKKPDDDKLQII